LTSAWYRSEIKDAESVIRSFEFGRRSTFVATGRLAGGVSRSARQGVIVLGSLVLCMRVDDHTSSEQQPPPLAYHKDGSKQDHDPLLVPPWVAPTVVQNSQDHDP
jgi:hypothetical protein